MVAHYKRRTRTMINPINRETIISFMSNIKGQRQGAIHYRSALTAFPKKFGFGIVSKIVERQCQFNRDYENSVNNALERNGMEREFVSGGLRKGERYMQNMYRKIIVGADGKQLYVVFFPYNGASERVQYFCNGVPATAEQAKVIAEWESAKDNRTIGTQAAVGLTEKQVQFRKVKIENITYMSCENQVLQEVREVM